MQGACLLPVLLTLLNWGLVQSQCSGSKSCRAKVRCVLPSDELASSECDLEPDGKGYCCDDVTEKKRIGISTRQDRPPLKADLLPPEGFTEDDVQLALRNAKIPQCCNQRNGTHNFFTQPREGNDDILHSAVKLLSVKTPQITIGVRESLSGFNSKNSDAIRDECVWETTRKPNCNLVPLSRDRTREYRTSDGGCNNIDNPLYGLAGTPLQRIVDPGTHIPYVNLLRTARDGRELPSARLVTNVVFREGTNKVDRDYTHLLMEIGQFLDHDITHVPTFSSTGCCDARKRDTDECAPIEVPRNDPVHVKTCMEFGRALFSPPIDCRATGIRENENDLTDWLDMSNIYESGQEQRDKLINPQERHLLLMSERSSGERGSPERSLLPKCLAQTQKERSLLDNKERERVDTCKGCKQMNNVHCFFSGDIRTNEHPGLATMHTVWVREHNRVASELAKLWSLPKEDIFQEARRIVIAEWQHMIYQEWLPAVIGKNYMQKFEMLPLSAGYSTGYKPNIDPRINSEFAGAAFRFGHSLVYTTLPQRDASNRLQSHVDLKTVFDNPSRMEDPDFMDNTLRGMVGDGTPAMDEEFTEDILHNLFEDNLDLPALNIQRARDFGIPGYNKYRGVCKSNANGFEAVTSIDELSRDGRISSDAVNKLKQVYDHIDDVDLFVGGILESHHDDAIVGPTFLCIIGDQFRRLKQGDRFWYENGRDLSTKFSLPQLDEIRKVSMARILCDNSDVGSMQPLAFRRERPGNSRVQCDDKSIPRIDLSVFVDR